MADEGKTEEAKREERTKRDEQAKRRKESSKRRSKKARTEQKVEVNILKAEIQRLELNNQLLVSQLADLRNTMQQPSVRRSVRGTPPGPVTAMYGVTLYKDVISDEWATSIVTGVSKTKLYWQKIGFGDDGKTSIRQQTLPFSPYTQNELVRGIHEVVCGSLLTLIKTHAKLWWSPIAKDIILIRSHVPDQSDPLPAQDHHRDFGPENASCLSCIVALEEGTSIDICTGVDTVNVVIPRLDMLTFQGCVAHGGAKYTTSNCRLFFKVVHAHWQHKDVVHLSDCKCHDPMA
jgi:hypothetical protein